MSLKTNIAIGVGAIVVIGSLLFIIKTQDDMIRKQSALEQSFVEQKELANNILRSQSSYVTAKDLETYAKDLKVDLNPIKEDLKKLNADIKSIQVVRVVSNGFVGSNLPSTSVTPNENPDIINNQNPDPHLYLLERQVLKLDEPFSNTNVPIGEVGFSAWKEKPWDLKVYERQYSIVNVLGMDENGRHYSYNKLYIDVNGKKHEIKITEAKYRQELPTAKFRFDPRLFAGIDAGIYVDNVRASVVPNMQIALFSYGEIKQDPTWTFLSFGLGYEAMDRKLAIVASPIKYNVAQHLPLVHNVHVRPTVMATPSGDFAVMLGLGFGL